MEEVICKKCGVVNEYKTEKRGNHLTAFCSACGAYIKHIPHVEPAMFFSKKYPNMKISECEDLQYLKFVHDKIKLSKRYKEAFERRIDELEGYKYI